MGLLEKHKKLITNNNNILESFILNLKHHINKALHLTATVAVHIIQKKEKIVLIWDLCHPRLSPEMLIFLT